MAKIERKFLAHFLNVAEPGKEAAYERLGKDLEEYKAELSAQVDKLKNILGQTTVVISGYEKSGAVEPYYAEMRSAPSGYWWCWLRRRTVPFRDP